MAHRDIYPFLLLIRRRAYDAGRRGGPFQMSPAAGLHPDNARRKLLRQSNQRLVPYLATHHNRAGRIQPNHAANVLA